MAGAIFNTYLYGSHVYGTNDKKSDIDYIYVVDVQREKEKQLFSGNMNITHYPLEYFQKMVDRHKVSALECIFLPEKYKIELRKMRFNLDLCMLRQSFSEKASNSWVKAGKKIDLHQEIRLGKKSLFHSLRILNFGIQIANSGRIVDFTSANKYWFEIFNQSFVDGASLKKYWKPEYNRLKSEFKKVAPLQKES